VKTIKIIVGDEVFQFSDFKNWCHTAKHKFESADLCSRDAICVDSKGRICLSGREFIRANR